jgi:hypothetical protein
MHYETDLSLVKTPGICKVLKRRSIELEEFLKSKGKESQILINTKEELREFFSEGGENRINDLIISIRDFVSYNISLDEIYEISLESKLNNKKTLVEKAKCLVKESALHTNDVISNQLNKIVNNTDSEVSIGADCNEVTISGDDIYLKGLDYLGDVVQCSV